MTYIGPATQKAIDLLLEIDRTPGIAKYSTDAHASYVERISGTRPGEMVADAQWTGTLTGIAIGLAQQVKDLSDLLDKRDLKVENLASNLAALEMTAARINREHQA